MCTQQYQREMCTQQYQHTQYQREMCTQQYQREIIIFSLKSFIIPCWHGLDCSSQ